MADSGGSLPAWTETDVSGPEEFILDKRVLDSFIIARCRQALPQPPEPQAPEYVL